MRLGSATRAAEELALAQPTVSCLLRKLSEAVGAPVACMRGRRMRPTAVGIALLALAEEIGVAFARYDARAAQSLARYDAGPADVSEPAWPSSFPPARPSRSKRRDSRSPLAKPKPSATTGAS